jgi:hypothetical protein
VFNYLGARETNIRLVEIEELKRNSDLEVYRYTNIFESLKELNTLPDIDYTYLSLDENGNYVQDKELFGKVVEQATERYSKVKKIYDRVKPIVNKNLLFEAEELVKESEMQSNLLVEALYTNSPLPEGVDVVTLMQARQHAEVKIKEAMEKQVAILTKSR